MGQRKEAQAVFATIIFAAFTGFFASTFINGLQSSWMWLGLFGCAVLLCLVAALVCLDICRLKAADSHTLQTLASQYVALLKLRIQATFLRREIYKLSKDPLKANTETLMRILDQNKNTEYGMKHKFSEITSPEEYTSLHPLTTYEDYRQMVDRIMEGEENILHPGPAHFLATSSGTTGRAKHFPLTDQFIKQTSHILEDMCRACNVLPMLNLKRSLRFHVFSQVNRTPANKPIGAASQVLFTFPLHNLMPKEYEMLKTEDSACYVMSVFSLAEKELGCIETFSADLMYSFMKFMFAHWVQICDDIEEGSIGTTVTMPENIRIALSAYLHANKERADDLRRIIKQGLVGLAKRAWPDLKFLTMGRSAGFKMSASRLMESYFSGVNVQGLAHGGAEGPLGLVLAEDGREEEETFTMVPWTCFWEFIPLEHTEEEDPKTVQIDELKLGSSYEIVATNPDGLYRLRYGDVIKIVGHLGKLPKYEFIYRLGQRLDIAGERTPDNFLYKALDEGISELGLKYSDFTTTESTIIEEITGEVTKSHYVFFIEFGDELLKELSALAQKIDHYLVNAFEMYKFRKFHGHIADLEVIQVQPGSMDGMKALVMGNKVNPQFKMPRVIRKKSVIKLLLQNRME